MVRHTITVMSESGLHARPSKELTVLAKKFASRIVLKKGEQQADVRSILQLMQLTITQNTILEVICEGDDEQQAGHAIVAFFQQLSH
jgi:phosphotransferase system HPr (HPr) family protein